MNDESSKYQAVAGTIVNTLSNSRSGFHLEIEADMGFCMGDRVWISRKAPASQPAEQPRGATDAQADDLAAALNQCADDLLDEDGPSSFSIAERLYELAAFHPAPSQAVGAVDVDAERMAFEADIRSGIFSDNAADHHLRRNKHGVYEVEEVEYQWDGWLSRANVVPRPAVATAGDGVTDEQITAALTADPYLNAAITTGPLAEVAYAAYKLALASPSAPRPGVPDEAIEAAAVDCARRAYGYWKGDSTGGSSAIEYFDRNRGLGGIQYTIEMMEGCIRKALLAGAPEVPRG